MSSERPLRIAIEGCGHGTLDAIYASVKKSCEVKGWDGVDLVIICGDFQAVRSQQDLNVTAMPAQYRKMGDFHRYYHGTVTAPWLTIFIGGNHEASNHLFELYYGGWAAPNIYYLGAANVIRFGPLKIAATSGVYKGYDYKKPHFERLPYNGSDMRSIYHQRELDTRKLLSYRSQVDIGLSHDWPSGIEWLGDHPRLFTKKSYLLEEAKAGTLGSKPSALVLERLRPPYWFSAHHHYRYVAYKVHPPSQNQQELPASKEEAKEETKAAVSYLHDEKSLVEKSKDEKAIHQTPSPINKAHAVSAWNTFKDRVQEQDAADDARYKEALRAKFEEDARTGQRAVATYTLEENFKEVGLVHSNGIQHRQNKPSEKQQEEKMSQLDGSCTSLPKRRRISSPSDEVQQVSKPSFRDQLDGPAPTPAPANPDAIQLDLSDSDSEDNETPIITKDVPQNEKEANTTENDQIKPPTNGHSKTNGTTSASEQAVMEDVSNDLNQTRHGKTNDKDTNEVADDVRALLAEMSTTFAPEEKVDKTPDLPFPSAIKNTETRFLALSKVEKGRSNDFLQLLEIHAFNDQDALASPTGSTTYKLEYDPEWLAITRVFATELTLGGSKQDKIPGDRGQTYYREQIIKEEVWVQENITNKGLLAVPENFVVQVQPQNLEMMSEKEKRAMPRELTNPQTADFCKLVGIENPFDISEEERTQRMKRGPAQDNWQQGGNRGNSGGGNRGQGGRGGRGGRGRGGRGGGRGRGH